MQIRINNYEILNFDTDTLLYSEKGITKIHSPNLERALRAIKETHLPETTTGQLNRVFQEHNLEPDEVLEFLKQVLTISQIKENPYFNKAHIYHDWEITSELTKYITKNTNATISLTKLNYDTPIIPAQKTFFVLSSLTLNPSKLRDLYFKTCRENTDCAICIGFISGNCFHLTEPFVPEIGNPCAFCVIDRIISYETQRPGFSLWTKMLNFCQTNRISLPPQPLDPLQLTLILSAIVKSITTLTTSQPRKVTQDSTLQSTTLNLESGFITKQSTSHWLMCECLRLNQ